MSANFVGPAGVTVTTPASRDPLVKVGILEVADGSTGFAAFVLPKYAVPIGLYTISAGANTTQTINVGYTNGGTDLLNAFVLTLLDTLHQVLQLVLVWRTTYFR